MDSSEPQASAPPSEPPEAEITPEAPKPKGRRMLIAVVIVAVIVIAAVAVWALVYLSTGSLKVNTTTQFVAAGDNVAFTAAITTPALVSAGTVTWSFGDNQTSTGSASATHAYPYAGTFYVAAASTLSNGQVVSNNAALFPMTVGPRKAAINPLGSDTSQGVLSINKTASSAGAPLIQAGGHVAFVGAIALEPDFFMMTRPTTTTWRNYTWAPVLFTLAYGDGAAPFLEFNTSKALTRAHTYANPGLYTAAFTVTTANYTTFSSGNGDSEPVAVTPAQFKNTTVGQTIAVGSYALVTFAGGSPHPDLLLNMEAVTGSYTSLDPAVDYESTGFEVISNIYQTLLWYNYSSSDQFVPVVADQIPTVPNGGISDDFMTYTFHIRQGLKFTDGTDVTPWDVKYSITRTMLFVDGKPGTSGWIISQYLVPTEADGSWNLSYAAVNAAIDVDNTSQTVTFHLTAPAPPTLFYQIIADPLGAAIISHTSAEKSGLPKLIWNDAGFADYQKYALLRNYVSAWRNGGLAGSGPYMIDYITPSESVAMKINPTFTPVTGMPRPTIKEVVLQYVADDSTRELNLESGKADIAGILPARFNVAQKLQGDGLVHILFVPTLNLFWWNFNFEIYQSGTGNNPYGNMVPPDFFVDINMRKAFFYAFDFQRYINTIVGNQVYNAKFAELYNGIIPKGMIGYQDLSSLDQFNMNLARAYYSQTQWVKDKGLANSGFTLAINVESADSVNQAAAAAWKQNLESLAPGIQILIKPISFEEMITDSVAHLDPMGIYYLGWLPDYPFPTDYTVPMLLPTTATATGGTYPDANGLNYPIFASDANGTNQLANLSRLYSYISDSLNTSDVPTIVDLSQKAQYEAANLTIYVPAQQQYTFFTYRTWIPDAAMQNEMNPMLGGTDLLYNYLSITGATSAASVSSSSTGTSLMAIMFLAFAAPAMTLALVGVVGRTEERKK